MSSTFGYRDRPWIPRFWDGRIAGGWFPLLWRNRFRISPRCWRRAAVTSAASLFNLVLWALQMALLGRRIRRTKILEDPIFVAGHWRSGTTLLHELLALDAMYI